MQFQDGQPTPPSEGLPPSGTPQTQGLGDQTLDTAAGAGLDRLKQQFSQQGQPKEPNQPPQQGQQDGQSPQNKEQTTYTQEQWKQFQSIKDKEVADAQRQYEAQARIAAQMEQKVGALTEQHQAMTQQWNSYQAQNMDPEQRAQFFQQQQQLTEQTYQQQIAEMEQRERMRQMKWEMANKYDIPVSELVSDDYGQDSQYVMDTIFKRQTEWQDRAERAEAALAAYKRGDQAANSVYPGENNSPPPANAWQSKYEDALSKVMQNQAPPSLVEEVRHGAHMAGVQLDFRAAERLSIGH